MSPHGEPEMRKEPLHHDDIFLICDFFTPAECADHIRLSEEAGYDDAPISTGRGAVVRKDVRNNDRVMIDDPTLAAELFTRAEPFLPPKFLIWKAVGLNERFRYYRYTKGQKFDWHFDGAFTRPDGLESSKLTFMVYLNDGFVGGETVFNLKRVGSIFDTDPVLRVFPTAGTALLFRHDLLHTGAVVLDGVKYVIRTDVMYRHTEAGGG
jgi:predicted 2-oxoglutarate/Fe(II)-dependent dioxygenase YbiX